MKNIIKILVLLGTLLPLTSCYDDYVSDYEYPNMGFALQRPLRTVVSGTNRIYVGVSIGGKREVDTGDWAKFVIDETLLEGTGMTLMPEEYYTLKDKDTFRVRKQNLAVADVEINFTDAFYADPLCLTKHYAIPFRLTSVSIPGDPETQPDGAIREGADYSIVAVKYISSYSGTWYKMGEVVEVDASGQETGSPVVYRNKDLSRNKTVALSTAAAFAVNRPGLADSDVEGGLLLTIDRKPEAEVYDVVVEGTEGGAEISGASGKLRLKGDYTFYSGDEVAPQFELEYTYKDADRYYKVKETLVLRQWAERELRVETF